MYYLTVRCEFFESSSNGMHKIERSILGLSSKKDEFPDCDC